VAYETERLIAEALYHRRPVYMAFPSDVANQTVVREAQPLDFPVSDKANLKAAAKTILDALQNAKTACILPGILAARIGAREILQSFVDASGLPFATMFMDKSVLDERQPGYIGMYVGKLLDESVRKCVESCDLILNIGAILTDFSSGAFTANLDPKKTVHIQHHHAQIGAKVFPAVEMKDLLTELALGVTKRMVKTPIQPGSFGTPSGSGKDPITADALYPRWVNFLKPNDIVFTETGTSAYGLAFALMPKDVTFHNQTLWGSIGWATPAAFGGAVAAPNRRLILVTGDGSHQLTVQEISQFGRRGLKPIIFVLNNSGYLIERLLCKNPDSIYNDLAQWRYAEIPHALGCDGWFTARVTTCGELDQALQAAEQGKGAYIEVVTDKYVATPLTMKIHENIKTLYRS
jgi:indolepyruvate decarboxylase